MVSHLFNLVENESCRALDLYRCWDSAYEGESFNVDRDFKSIPVEKCTS
jgi:hypothetical protein